LEALAEPGAICVSDGVRDQIEGKLAYAFADVGPQQLKNIAWPVGAHTLSRTAVAATPPPLIAPVRHRPALPQHSQREQRPPQTGKNFSAPRLSIVVLPFINLSSDPEQEYFADAVTDDLTIDLARLEQSFVIARTIAAKYKRKPIDIKKIGRELGVHYVVE